MARVVIVIEGGLVQEVLSDKPIECMVIDHDIDGMDENRLATFHPGKGNQFQAVAHIWDVKVIPDLVATCFRQLTEE